jgi:hypothetical protein
MKNQMTFAEADKTDENIDIHQWKFCHCHKADNKTICSI